MIEFFFELLKLLAAFTGDPSYDELISSCTEGDVTMCRFVDQFRNEGMERGLEQGLERGLVQGRTDEQKRIAENMLTQGLKDALIISVTGITQECLNTIKDTLQPCK